MSSAFPTDGAAAPRVDPAPSRSALPSAGAARGDALRVVVAAGLTFATASAFQWQEHLAALAMRFERWQVDELPLTLLTLALGLAWFAARRRSETVHLLALNRELAQRLLEVQERERREIARELHDELAQHCTVIRVESACLRRAGEPAEAAAAAHRVAEAAALMQSGVGRLLRRLRPPELDALGLAAALASLAASWEARTGVAIELHADGPLERIDIAVATAVYRIVQEALANVVRHAAASRVRVEVRAGPAALVLSVADDGCGFDPARRTQGLGLVGAAERAAALGGSFAVDSAPGSGTRLAVTLPRPEAKG